ncbi:MAG: hypothetical protein WBL45_13270 [Solirubrobacterales bacterium]
MNKGELRQRNLGTVLGAIGAVMGFAALVISLSGSAEALPGNTLVKKGDLAPGAVTAKAIAPGAVRPKAIARSAVTSKALAKGAVNKRVIGKGAVIASSIADNAVTKSAIAPGSVYGGALGEQTIHAAPIADADQVASNPDWTAGNSEVALCAPGERLLSAGFAFTNPGNREATFLQAIPFISAQSNGVNGRMATNSGGTAQGQIVALCLK